MEEWIEMLLGGDSGLVVLIFYPSQSTLSHLIDLTLFLRAGVLLRRLLGDSSLAGTTHVVVDEVHERSADSDLLLLLLRDLLASGCNPQLRVVLMSATAEAGLFQSYFDAELAKVIHPILPVKVARRIPNAKTVHFCYPGSLDRPSIPD